MCAALQPPGRKAVCAGIKKNDRKKNSAHKKIETKQTECDIISLIKKQY
ncbi:hypothetical protein ELI_1472 [Eubacterium callanderi]|uniref:Uncharacterized protein n=1 Tax=Eubacterium callanderi TaxID=53442 RepID=E3GLE4_9FIRM|nr:hypothetical protein ELI_1472 [Eubacterium callanderi]